ncbi:MAG: HRDC domain-containing protein [Anaerolineae bacterium]|nr:HRDC domain-containing protein [Anaerolineae bacterium]
MIDRQSLPPPIWVDTQANFRLMLANLQGEPGLAVDTESNSLYVYAEQVCLIQISVPGADYLIDPFVLDDISGLGPLFADPGVLKVLHGAEYDVAVLERDFGFTFQNLFDTMWASRILGWPAHGLGDLLAERFGVHMNKKFQRANWGIRPLPPAQLDYARLDTHYLLALYHIQKQELDATGRWPQAQHRFADLVKVRWQPRGFQPDDFWRLSGVCDLDDPGRGVLRELYTYRDQRARAENRPVFRVISNKALLMMSERRPANYRELQQISGISPRMVKKYGRALLTAIRRGEAQPLAWRDRPCLPRRDELNDHIRPSPNAQARFEALRTWRNATAQARGVAPDIVLSNHVLWDVANRNPRNYQDLTDDNLLADWQVKEFGDDLLAILRRVRATR